MRGSEAVGGWVYELVRVEGRKELRAVSANKNAAFGELLFCCPTLEAQLSWFSGDTGQKSSIVEIWAILVGPLHPHPTAQGLKATDFPYSVVVDVTADIAEKLFPLVPELGDKRRF